MGQKQVTIQDIARVANVSKSTVSRVLNSTAAVHPDKRKAVLEAIERLGFKPNVVASSLARGRSMTIGVLTQVIGSPFYDTIAQGVIAGLSGTGYSPIFVDGRWDSTEEVDAIRALLGRRVDGLVVIGGSVPAGELASLCDGHPTVIAARQVQGGTLQCVYMDNVDGGYQATKHLIERGHRRIAIVRGLETHQDSVDRFAGYQQALLEAGLPLDLGLVQQGDFSAESGVRAVERLLAQKSDFTGIVAANDLTAFGVRLALYRHQLRVPEDVSITGFDDQMEASYMTPPLTTIRQPAREIGERASTAVLSMIKGEAFTSLEFRGELIERESVARLN